MKILIVSHVFAVRQLIRDALAGEFEAEAVDSPMAAMRFMEAVPQDLVVSDVDMGVGASGFDLLAAVQQQCPKTKVVLMSGTDYAKQATEAGAVGFWPKSVLPEAIEQLRRMIREALA